MSTFTLNNTYKHNEKKDYMSVKCSIKEISGCPSASGRILQYANYHAFFSWPTILCAAENLSHQLSCTEQDSYFFVLPQFCATDLNRCTVRRPSVSCQSSMLPSCVHSACTRTFFFAMAAVDRTKSRQKNYVIWNAAYTLWIFIHHIKLYYIPHRARTHMHTDHLHKHTPLLFL